MCKAVNWIKLRNVCVFIGYITENPKGPTQKEKRDCRKATGRASENKREVVKH